MVCLSVTVLYCEETATVELLYHANLGQQVTKETATVLVRYRSPLSYVLVSVYMRR